MDCPAFLKPSVLCDFLLCGEGWCWKLSDMKFICQYLLDICLHWCKSMNWYLQMIGFAWWRGHWIPTSSPFPPAPRAISQPNPPGTPQLPACQVNSRSTGEGHWRIQGHWKKNNLCSRNEDCYKICLMDMYLQIKFA